MLHGVAPPFGQQLRIPKSLETLVIEMVGQMPSGPLRRGNRTDPFPWRPQLRLPPGHKITLLQLTFAFALTYSALHELLVATSPTLRALALVGNPIYSPDAAQLEPPDLHLDSLVYGTNQMIGAMMPDDLLLLLASAAPSLVHLCWQDKINGTPSHRAFLRRCTSLQTYLQIDATQDTELAAECSPEIEDLLKSCGTRILGHVDDWEGPLTVRWV
jgi:hypothetical protein